MSVQKEDKISHNLLEKIEKKMILNESKIMQFTGGGSLKPKHYTPHVQDIRLIKQLNRLKILLNQTK